jgi:RimJ/RimL family protein N-acetyltransferase
MFLESERLILRPLEMEDAEAVFAYRSDEETNRYQGFIPENMEELLTWMKKRPASFNEPNSWFQLAIICKESKQLMGDVGIHFLEDKKICELGCTLIKKEHGKGYAKEALQHVIQALFEEWDKTEIRVQFLPNNHASARLVKSLGFEACSPKAESETLHFAIKKAAK